MTCTIGTLLDGRVRYRQSIRGHRSGIEPVLLAAAIPASPGARVLEGGTGAGAGLLCLGHRVAAITGVGIERDLGTAALAADNFAVNRMASLAVIAADVERLPVAGRFDHCFANPPWRPAGDTASPDPGRRLAHRAVPGLLRRWAASLAQVLRAGGSLTLIMPASLLDEGMFAMREAGCGSCRILPLWPRAGRAAKLLILQARRDRRGSTVLLPGLVLHDAAGYSAAANAILRDGAALDLG